MQKFELLSTTLHGIWKDALNSTFVKWLKLEIDVEVVIQTHMTWWYYATCPNGNGKEWHS